MLEERAGEEEGADAEVDGESGDVHECGDEGGGGGGGVELESFEEEREHRADENGPEDDAEDGGGDGGADLDGVVRFGEADEVEGVGDGEAVDAEGEPEDEACDEFVSDDASPVGE